MINEFPTKRKRNKKKHQLEWSYWQNKQNERKWGREIAKVKVSKQLVQIFIHFLMALASSAFLCQQIANQIVNRQTFDVSERQRLYGQSRENDWKHYWADGRYVLNRVFAGSLFLLESLHSSFDYDSIDAPNLTFNTNRWRFHFFGSRINNQIFLLFLWWNHLILW